MRAPRLKPTHWTSIGTGFVWASALRIGPHAVAPPTAGASESSFLLVSRRERTRKNTQGREDDDEAQDRDT